MKHKKLLLLIAIIILTGLFGSYYNTYKDYDLSNVSSNDSVTDYDIFDLPENKNKEFPTDFLYVSIDPLRKIQFHNLTSKYIIIEFQNSLPEFTKVQVIDDNNISDYPGRFDNYFIFEVKSPNPTILLYEYGKSSITNVYCSDSIPFNLIRSYNYFYGSLFLSALIILLYFIFKKLNIQILIPRELFLYSLVYCIFFVLYLLAARILNMYGIISLFRLKFLYFIISIFSILFVVYKHRNSLQICVPLIIIILSTLIIFSTGFGAYSWDELTHFKRSLDSLSYGNMNYSVSAENYRNINIETDIFKYDSFFKDEYAYRMDLYNWIPYYLYFRPLNFSNIFFSLPYIPGGIVLLICNCFKIPLSISFILAKIPNLLVFAMLSYLILSKTSNKILITCIFALPTVIFLASNYSYDPWTIAFLTLSIVEYIETLKSNKKFSKESIFIIMFSLFCVATAKAAYIGIALAYIFTSKKYFINKKQFYIWHISILIVILSTVLAYSNTQWVRNDTTNLYRPKIIYILQNPIQFIVISLKYIFLKFSSFEFSYAYTVNFSDNYPDYFRYILPISVVLFAFLDKDEHDIIFKTSNRIAMIISSILTLLIMCTTIYIDFTPVGTNTIIGMQHRYLIPLLFPILYSVSGPKIVNNYDKNILYPSILLMYSAMCLYMIFTLIIFPKI